MLCERFVRCPETPTTFSSPGQHPETSTLGDLRRFLLVVGAGQPSISSPETSGTGKNTEQAPAGLSFDLGLLTSRCQRSHSGGFSHWQNHISLQLCKRNKTIATQNKLNPDTNPSAAPRTATEAAHKAQEKEAPAAAAEGRSWQFLGQHQPGRGAKLRGSPWAGCSLGGTFIC